MWALRPWRKVRLDIVKRPEGVKGFLLLPKRWIVERTIGWLGNFRRLLIRWERHVHMYRAFMNVACLLITARQL